MNTESMLANAFNNAQSARIAIPRAVITSGDRERLGSRLVALEDVPVAELRAAMDWYKANTDWSAFSKKQFAAALSTLA